MARLILRVTSTGARTPLARLLTAPLGLDVLSYHSYSQLVLYPWGYTSEPIEDEADLAEMRTLADDMKGLIRGVHGETDTAQQASELYPTAGDTTDWTYGEFGVPSFTIELRPASALDGGFLLPAAQIQPCWEENRPAALGFVRHVLERPGSSET